MGRYNPQMGDRQSIRLPNYDYASNGTYFVTLCSKNRQCLFGEVIDGEMRKNHFGSVIETCWRCLEQKYEYVSLDQFITMPNHIHGILHIDQSLAMPDTKIKPLGRLIGVFKTISAKQINQLCETSGQTIWQRNFYEHIIRDQKSLTAIRQYIVENPRQWRLDEDNPVHLSDYQELTIEIPF